MIRANRFARIALRIARATKVTMFERLVTILQLETMVQKNIGHLRPGSRMKVPPVRLILHPYSNSFELISPSGYIAVTLQEFKIIN